MPIGEIQHRGQAQPGREHRDEGQQPNRGGNGRHATNKNAIANARSHEPISCATWTGAPSSLPNTSPGTANTNCAAATNTNPTRTGHVTNRASRSAAARRDNPRREIRDLLNAHAIRGHRQIYRPRRERSTARTLPQMPIDKLPIESRILVVQFPPRSLPESRCTP